MLTPRRSFLLAFVSAAGLLAANAQDASPALTRIPIPSHYLKNLASKDRTDYYGLYMKEHKIGWMRTTRRLGTYREQPAYIDEIISFQTMLSGEEELEFLSVDREFFSTEAPYPFLGAVSESNQGTFHNTFEVHRSGEEFLTTSKSGDESHAKALAALDYTLEDALTSETWCLSEPPVGASLSCRTINWEKTSIEPQHFTIGEVLEASGEGRYRIHYASDDAATTGELLVSSEGIALEGVLGGAYRFVREEEETAKRIDEKIDIFESSLTPTDKPLGDPTTVTKLVLDIAGAGAEKIPDGGMQTAEYNAATGILHLTIRSKDYERQPAEPEEVAEASRATFSFPSDDEEIRKLARRAVGNAKSDYAKVQRLVDFVDSYIVDDSNVEPPTVRDIIRVRRGDCTEHSALFVTLARAVGLPAREVSGLIYGEDATQSFGGHAWCEVAIANTWHPVDPSWGETMPNATHLRASSGPSGSDELAILLGGLKFTVVSVEHASPARSILDFSSRLLKGFGSTP